MRMKAKDRLVLSVLLPREGNLLTLRIVRKLKEDLEFTAEEAMALKIHDDGQQMKWDISADKDVEIPLEAEGFKLIVDEFVKLDQSNKLTIDHLPVYEKFLAVMANA